MRDMGYEIRDSRPRKASDFSRVMSNSGRNDMRQLILTEVIEKKIFLLRGQRVMLSSHLAELYDVEPRSLIQAIGRNADRFPSDFMFQLNADEWQNLKSQFVISSWGGIRKRPYAFTEQGVAMLSSCCTARKQFRVAWFDPHPSVPSPKFGRGDVTE